MKKLYFGVGSLISLVFLGGCVPTVTDAGLDAPQYIVQFNGDDFNIGDVVIVEMNGADNPKIKDLLLNKALNDNQCDAILLPRYETFSNGIVRLTGRSATLRKH